MRREASSATTALSSTANSDVADFEGFRGSSASGAPKWECAAPEPPQTWRAIKAPAALPGAQGPPTVL